MSKKDPGKRTRKHIPQRTCVGCRSVINKKELVRIVRTPEGIKVDPTGKMPGRGAYLHNSHSCWEKGLKGSLGIALKRNISDLDRKILLDFMANLPDSREINAEMEKK